MKLSCYREPTIILSGSKGLSKVQIEALQEQLEQLARELRGEVMILQLAQSVQEYLHEHNKPGTKSFYDEMLERNLFLEQQRNRSEEYKKIIEVFIITYVLRVSLWLFYKSVWK